MIFSHQSSFSKLINLTNQSPLTNLQINQAELNKKDEYNDHMIINDHIKIEQQSQQEKRQVLCLHNNKIIKLQYQINLQKIKKINQKSGKYKRANNNSHKKFISVAKKLYLSYLTKTQKLIFKRIYSQYKHSLKYFCIILVNAYYKLNKEQLQQFKTNFNKIMKNKIYIYRQQAQKSSNADFIRFRNDEISDMLFSMKAFQLFFEGEVQKAVTTLYKKYKDKILRRGQFDECLTLINTIKNLLQNKTQIKEQSAQNKNIYHRYENNKEIFSTLIKQEQPSQSQYKYQINPYISGQMLHPFAYLSASYHSLHQVTINQANNVEMNCPRIKIQHNENLDFNNGLSTNIMIQAESMLNNFKGNQQTFLMQSK